jgi:hypothetical protein
MLFIKRFLFGLSVILCFSCQTIQPVKLKNRKIEFIPIILGFDKNDIYNNGEHFQVLAIAEYMLLNQLNITLKSSKIFYTSEYFDMQWCSYEEFDYINRIDIGELVGYQCDDTKIIIFMEYVNQCLNLRGCADLAGILNTEPTRMFFYLTGNSFDDSYVLVHEIGHILGADHISNGYIMHPYTTETNNYEFCEESKKQIDETLQNIAL